MTQLNPRQTDAVKYIDGPLLVLAGAGSGKTSVITRKISYLIKICEIPARHIYAVTFTNKAAREMKERVGKLVSGKIARGLVVSTFHNLGLNIIRREYQALGLKPGFSIFDDQDSKSLLAELMHRDEHEEDALDGVRGLISNWKNDLVTPERAKSFAEDKQGEIAAHVYQSYERHLRAYNAVDFDDLILLPTLLMRDNQAVRERWQNKIHYLLVDEYQDTNSSQYLLVKLLVGVRNALTVVGDDDQSIYAWRGARPENLVQLKQDYPNLKVIKLEQNYRSMGCILKAANQVISNNPHVFEKKLWSQLGFGDPIRIIRAKTEDHEAERIATEIINQKLRHNWKFKDFAVLYRGNFQSRLLEMKLQAFQIPYKVSGGTSFFSRAEIKDLMGYLRVMLNPDDDNAFLRIVNTPRREVGPSTLEKLGQYATGRGVSLYEASFELGLEQTLSGRPLTALKNFTSWLEGKAKALYEADDPVRIIRELVDDINYEQWLSEQSSSPKMAERRTENVYHLIGTIGQMLSKDDNEGVEAVIGKLVLRDILEQREQEDDTDRVQLMTLHASKGLEFPHVFLMGMEEELLPHRSSIEAGTLEEERRLLYVGITRAQRSLTMTLAAKRKQYGETFETSPSRFLEELPAEDITWEGEGVERPEEEKKAVGRAHLDNLKSLLEL